MKNNVEIILIGSVNRLIDSLDDSIRHNCINLYKDAHNLIAITHEFDELMYFMKNSSEFTDREYVLKELTEEEEDKYLALFAITNQVALSSIIYEELKDLPTTKYPREE